MNKRPQQSGNGMFVQVQTSVEIQSSVSISYRCSEKEYERLFIREPEVKARAGKMRMCARSTTSASCVSPV